MSTATTLRLQIREDLLSTNAAEFREKIAGELAAAAATKPGIVEIDLRGARMIDSVGLNLLVMVIKKAQSWQGRTRLIVDDANVRRTLQFTRLDNHAEIAAS